MKLEIGDVRNSSDTIKNKNKKPCFPNGSLTGLTMELFSRGR